MHCELPQCSASARMWAGTCNLGLPSLSFAFPSGLCRPDIPHKRWLVVVWLAGVSSADGLYAVALWRGCLSASASASGPFWPPVPRAAAAAAWRGRGWVPIAGWSLGGVGPDRGLRGEEDFCFCK